MRSAIAKAFQTKRFIHTSAVRRAADAGHHGSASTLTVNFSTPYTSIHKKKEATLVVLPGEEGEFAINAGRVPTIAQLQAGVVAIHFTDGQVEKYVVPGGFAVSNKDSVADISVTDAFNLDEFDSAAVKAALDDANARSAKADNAKDKAQALVELHVYGIINRALGGH